MLGDTLREAREKQGLTYKDIEKGTSIRALYIEYIEKGEYDELPGDVYTKGFIRSYANFLKLDANALVQAFTAERHKGAAPAAQQKPAAPKAAPEKPQAKKSAAPSVQPAAKSVEKTEKSAKAETIEKDEKPVEQPAAPKQEAAPRKAPVQPKATAVKPQPKQQPKKAPASKPAAPRFTAQDFNEPKRSNGKLIAIVLVVLAGAVYALSGSDDSAKKPATQQTQQVEAPAPKTYDGVEVTATFTADCWLEVKADGKTVYEGTLKKGDSQTWKGTDKVTVRVGDAGAVSFSVNGKDLGTAGKTGQVANKTFTKDGN